MEQQNRQPGAPIGPEAQQKTSEQPRHGFFGGSIGRLLHKAGLRRSHPTFGPEPGKVMQQGGLITTESTASPVPEVSAPATIPAAPLPRVENVGFGAPTMPSAGPKNSEGTSPEYTMRGGTLMSTSQAERLDTEANPYPSAATPRTEHTPFTGGSAIPPLSAEQAARAMAPVAPNSMAQPTETSPPAGPLEGTNVPPVHSLPIDGQPRQ